MRLAIWGCGHGTLDRAYAAVAALESSSGARVDALICCGDFQAARDERDVAALACPPKHHAMMEFYKYYGGSARAPLLTLFIGGNHEATAHLRELPLGGWVAPGIYFLGGAGAVRLGGLRIAGVSGILAEGDFRRGFDERCPYGDRDVRSVCHMREFDVWRLHCLAREGGGGGGGGGAAAADVMLTHDWPAGVYYHGDHEALTRRKKHFLAEVRDGSLGNRETAALMPLLRPR